MLSEPHNNLPAPSLGDPLSHLTREVRSSLSSVLGFVETLYDSSQTTKEKFLCLRKIRSIIEQTAKGLEDLEHISSFKKGWLSVRSQQFSLEEELGDTMRSLDSEARKEGLKLQWRVEKKIPSIVLSDPLRLKQLLAHTIRFFLHHTERGSTKITFQLDEKGWLQINFDSTGENLSDEAFEELIGEPVPSSPLSIPKAWGRSAIDISLIHALVSALGARSTVSKSQLGKGYSLTIHLDPGPPTPEASMIDTLLFKSAEIMSNAKSIQIPRFENQHFLVVEDDPDIAAVLINFLRRTGAHVTQASDGEEGYLLSLENKYDLILLDLQLPKMNGLEVCSNLRERYPSLPIVALTANSAVSIKLKCKEAGFSLFLTKPVSIESLFDIIPKLLMD